MGRGWNEKDQKGGNTTSFDPLIKTNFQFLGRYCLMRMPCSWRYAFGLEEDNRSRIKPCRKWLQNIKEHTKKCEDTISKTGHNKLLHLPSQEPNDAPVLMSSRKTPKLSERAKGGRWVTM